LLASFSPLMIVLVSYLLLRERFHSGQAVGMMLSLVGVFWIVSHGNWTSFARFEWNLGDLLMLVANLIWALYSILVRRTAETMPTAISFTISIIVGLLFLLPASLWEIGTGHVQFAGWQTAGSVVYLGVFASVAAFLCWNKAVQHLGPGKVSPFLNLIPLFATIFAMLLLGEKLLLAQAIGGMFILTGVTLSFRPARRRAVVTQEPLSSGSAGVTSLSK
jgi:drug/metabolite transporter (DMT)-like permease